MHWLSDESPSWSKSESSLRAKLSCECEFVKKGCFVWARAHPSGSLSASLSNWKWGVKMEGISAAGPARWAGAGGGGGGGGGGEVQSWEAILFPAASLPPLLFPPFHPTLHLFLCPSTCPLVLFLLWNTVPWFWIDISRLHDRLDLKIAMVWFYSIMLSSCFFYLFGVILWGCLVSASCATLS